MIEGLLHVTLVVTNLDRMSAVLTQVLGAREVYPSGDDRFSESREKFFVAGNVWIAIMEGEALSSRTYNHIAFKIDDFDRYAACAQKLGLDIRPPRRRVEGEGRSIYFYDHDNHLFELHTGTLAERLERYAKGREAVG